MPKALKGRMPRVLKDHRSHIGKQLREGYDALVARFNLQDPIGRRVAVMTEQAWLEYRTLSAELDDLVARPLRGKERALAIARLRRRRDSVAGRYLGGLRTLAGLAVGNGHGPDIAAALARLRQEDEA